VLDASIVWLSQHATLVVLVNLSLGLLGVPALSETVLLTAGIMMARGGGVPWHVMLAAVLGSAVGMTTCFQMGRFSHLLLAGRLARGMNARRKFARVDQWSRRFGPWSVVLAFFTPGLRHVTAIAIGATRLEFKRFLRFAAGGACVWSVCLLGGGYLIGRGATALPAAASPRQLLTTTISRAIRQRTRGVPSHDSPHEIRRLRGDAPMPDFVIADNDRLVFQPPDRRRRAPDHRPSRT
jgi:membrane protein DedA with SNARE-associated domain